MTAYSRNIYLVSIHRNMIDPLAIMRLTETRERHIHRMLRMMKNHSMRNNRFGFADGVPCGVYEDNRNTWKNHMHIVYVCIG